MDLVVIIGLLGTGGALGSWLSEWWRNRRDDCLRWHSERRAAYERFLSACAKLRESGLIMAEHIGNLRQITGWEDAPLFDEEHLLQDAEKLNDQGVVYSVRKVRHERKIVGDAYDQIECSLAAIEIISEAAVVATARTYYKVLCSFLKVADEYPPRECGGWSDPLLEASEQAEESREAFVTAVRKELGVKP